MATASTQAHQRPRSVYARGRRAWTRLLAGLLVLLSLPLLPGSVRSLRLLVQTVGSGQAAMGGGPALFVQGGLTAHVGGSVTIPIAFEGHGAHVSSLSFSLDYDRACLHFEPTDQDANGLPDALTFRLPGQFLPSVIVRPESYGDELHIVIADYGPPFAALQDAAALVTVRLRVICADPLPRTAQISFFPQPPVSFSDQNGRDLPGLARGGTVTILSSPAGATPIPPPTSTMLPTAPATPTLLPTAMSPTPTPWMQLTARAAPDQLTVADTNAMLVIDYASWLPVDTSELSIVLPPQAHFNLAASTVGWQCPPSPASDPCRLPIAPSELPPQASGRIFFAITLDWVVFPIPAQLEFTIAAVSDNHADRAIVHLTLPVFLPRQARLPAGVDLELQVNTPVLVVQPVSPSEQLTEQLTEQLIYQLTYTNPSTLPLADLALHLLLPDNTSFQAMPETALAWDCVAMPQAQALCTAPVAELVAGVRQQEPFLLQVTQAAPLQTRHVLVLVAYVTSGELVLGSVASVVPIRAADQNSHLFLPIILTAAPA